MRSITDGPRTTSHDHPRTWVDAVVSGTLAVLTIGLVAVVTTAGADDGASAATTSPTPVEARVSTTP